VREVEGALIQLLAAELRQPRVTVELIEAAGNLIHVFGQVKDPGSYPAGPFMTLSQAIATAGGFSDDASKNSVMVFHRDGARTVRVARIQLGESIRRGTLDADLPLSRFDIVYVPRSTIGNIEVFVRQIFGPANLGLNTLLVGWELFNVEKVYVGASRPVAPAP
jgi:polysaccharide export outer membrane protein